MEEIVIKSGKLKKKSFKLDRENEELIKEIAEKFNIPAEKIVEMALLDEKGEKEGDEKRLQELREELLHLQKEMFVIEGEWSSLRYKAHTIAHDVKTLSVVLIGLVNQNRTLRRQLKMEEKYREMRELAEHYLFMKMKS